MHLAHLNISYGIASIDSPELADFVAQIDAVNAIADRSPGFVWRLDDESDEVWTVEEFNDDSMIVNMSVWESIKSLKDYVYSDGHLKVMKQKTRWFKPNTSAHMVLWWIPESHIPTLEEAKTKLDLLNEYGPTPEAFTFSQSFNPM